MTLHISAGYLTLGLDSTGTIVELIDSRSGLNYIAPDKAAPLVTLVINERPVKPTAVMQSSTDSTLYTFVNGNLSTGFEIDVRILTKNGYTTFEVISVALPASSSGTDVQTLLWGPLPTVFTPNSPGQVVGEVVGVVRNDVFAIGLKPLNDRTEGAWPKEYPQSGWESDVDPNPYKLTVASMEPWSVAAATSWGSILRAFTFDYTRQRDRLNANGDPVPVGPLSRGGSVIGSKIALFGSAPDLVTTLLSFIASGEGLPYPTQNGQWQKVAQASSQSFLVLGDLNTNKVGTAAQLAKAAGINYIYSLPLLTPLIHAGPWESTGHYQFDSSFGGSDAGAGLLVSQSEAQGVHVGVHTLSDFISANDPYVAPPPADARLAVGGHAALTKPLGASDTTLYLNDSAPLQSGIYGSMLRIQDEFIKFASYQKSGNEWQVTGLQRGQWFSLAVSAPAGALARRVIVNGYGGAIGGLDIIDEIVARLGTIWNKTGIRANSFDGVESASQTGWGSYGISRLVNGVYTIQARRDGYITETSRMTSNVWDTLTRASWGEQGSDSMPQLFLNNIFYQANYLPGMLGWVGLDGYESLIDVETTLARGAGLNAGTDFQTSVTLLPLGVQTPALDKIKQWETARNLGAFTDAQKTAFRDLSTYWTLTAIQAGKSWSLQQLTAEGDPIGSPQTVLAPTPQLSSTIQPYASFGVLYEAKVTSNTPATIRFSVTNGTLPPGLQLNQDTGGIVGTPGQAGRYAFTITATNNEGLADVSADYQILVK